MAFQLSRRALIQTLTLTKNPQFNLTKSMQFSTTPKPRLIEVDLDSSSSSSSSDEVMGLRKLEDAIHSIMVRRLAPDWLPFRPGFSYWVPPKPSSSSSSSSSDGGDGNRSSLVEIVDKLANPLTMEESLSLSSDRGWPSSFFFCGESIPEPVPVKVEVHVIVPSNSGKTFMSEDEEDE